MALCAIKHLILSMNMKSNSQISSALLFLVGLASLGIAVAFFYTTASLLNAFILSLVIGKCPIYEIYFYVDLMI